MWELSGKRNAQPLNKRLRWTAEHPFDKCYLDFVGPLPVTQWNNKYILTFQDGLSKYEVAVPIGQQDAETVVIAFVMNVVLK